MKSRIYVKLNNRVQFNCVFIAAAHRDQSGFSLNPTGVYAWLPKENACELPAQRGNVLTVAGFSKWIIRYKPIHIKEV